MAEGFDAFSAAESTVNTVEAMVADRISAASDIAEAAQTAALSTINDLKNTKFSLPEAPPAPPEVDAEINVNFDVNPINASDFGSVAGPDVDSDVVLQGVNTITPVTIPTFDPTIKGLSIPAAPQAETISRPAEQTFPDTVTVPSAPVLANPVLDPMSVITIPEFVFPTLPTFDATAPEFEGSPLPTVFEWSEPVYQTEILDEAIVKIRAMFAGGSGLPAPIEQALFERMNDREDQLVARAVSEVFTEWSDRGFTTPPGMLNARVDNIRQDALMKKQGANRELTIEFARIEVENLKFAVQQALAAEQVLINIFMNSAARMFEAAKYQVQSLIEIYNAQVALFNARQIAYQTAASVYKTRLEGELAKLEVFKAQIQGEMAKAQVNESLVRAYVAKIQAVSAQVEVYKAKLEGAKVEVDVIRGRIEAYKTSIEAYTANVTAEKVKFDTYAAQVNAEAQKATIVDSQARAYAAQIQGIATGVQAQKAIVDADIAGNELRVRAYVANLERDKTRMQYQLNSIQAAVSAFTADTQRYIAQADSEKTKAQLQISVAELESKTALALYGAVSSSYNARMEQMIREASLTVEGLKAAGQTSTTLAAAAFSAVHVGANLSGGGSLTASGSVSDSYSRSISESTNTNYNYEGT